MQQQAGDVVCPFGTLVKWWSSELEQDADIEDRRFSGDIAGPPWLPQYQQLCKKANYFSCMQRIPLLWRGHEVQSLTQLLLHGRHTIQILALHGTGRSYAATATEGPPQDKVTGLPFTVSPAEADEAYDGFHSTANRVLTAQPAARVGKKESYLPFWICRAEVCGLRVLLRGNPQPAATTNFSQAVLCTLPAQLPSKLAPDTRSRNRRKLPHIRCCINPVLLYLVCHCCSTAFACLPSGSGSATAAVQIMPCHMLLANVDSSS